MSDPKDTPATLASRLESARKAKGLSARKLSVSAGLAPALVGMIERGKVTNPHTDTLSRIAAVLEVSLQWLAEGQRVEHAGAA